MRIFNSCMPARHINTLIFTFQAGFIQEMCYQLRYTNTICIPYIYIYIQYIDIFIIINICQVRRYAAAYMAVRPLVYYIVDIYS